MQQDEQVMSLLKLATELWPKWRVTKGIADLFIDEFSGIDIECAENAIRKHRLERSTVPDLKAMVDGARAAERSRLEAAANSIRSGSAKFDEKLWRGRLRVCRKQSNDEQWTQTWRYCREFAGHRPGIPWVSKSAWPPHWADSTPEPEAWPVEVLWAFGVAAEKMGWWRPQAQ